MKNNPETFIIPEHPAINTWFVIKIGHDYVDTYVEEWRNSDGSIPPFHRTPITECLTRVNKPWECHLKFKTYDEARRYIIRMAEEHYFLKCPRNPENELSIDVCHTVNAEKILDDCHDLDNFN